MNPSTYLTFGPDPPLSSLHPAFISCLPPNSATAACDQTVGSSIQMVGMCALPEYRQTTYCSCVNNSVPCPEFVSPPCANSGFSYKPYSWSVKNPLTDKSKTEVCADFPLCINYLNIAGTDEELATVSQQCGIITNPVANQTNVIFFTIVFVLGVLLVYTMLSDDQLPTELVGNVLRMSTDKSEVVQETTGASNMP